jgi:hypothetical protein
LPNGEHHLPFAACSSAFFFAFRRRRGPAGLDRLAARLARDTRMIQITAQMRVLVAIEPKALSKCGAAAVLYRLAV